jgi:hypothetical protein
MNIVSHMDDKEIQGHDGCQRRKVVTFDKREVL